MKLKKKFVIFFASSVHALYPEDIKTKVGDGCATRMTFDSSFVNDAGSPCTSCSFCPISELTHLFDPKISSICVECEDDTSTCDKLQVITTFEEAWMMTFFSLLPSNAPSSEWVCMHLFEYTYVITSYIFFFVVILERLCLKGQITTTEM